MSQMPLNEQFENWNENLTLDVENRLVLNVALAGQSSRNGYFYTDEALTAAVALYECRPVFLDHAANRQRPHERSTRDLVGSVTNPRFVAGRVRGDIRVLETESGQTFLKLVEAQTPGVGMSHVVLAERSPDGKSVQRITDVISVDVVVNPATTTTFSESSLTNPEEAHQEEISEATAKLATISAERDSLLAEVHRLKKNLVELENREAVRQLVSNSGLPREAVSECFQRQLLQAATPVLREQLLQDRLMLLSPGRRTATRIVSQERSPCSTRHTIEDEFVRVLKRR